MGVRGPLRGSPIAARRSAPDSLGARARSVEFSPNVCSWGSPESLGLALLVLSVLSAFLLGAFLLVHARRRSLFWLGWLLLAFVLYLLVGYSALLIRNGVDWRWARVDFTFATHPVASVALVCLWWVGVTSAALLLRRRSRRGRP